MALPPLSKPGGEGKSENHGSRELHANLRSRFRCQDSGGRDLCRRARQPVSRSRTRGSVTHRIFLYTEGVPDTVDTRCKSPENTRRFRPSRLLKKDFHSLLPLSYLSR